MKKKFLNPNGMLKTNLEIFSDLGKWLITSGGMWLYSFGFGFICMSFFLTRVFGVDDIKVTKGMIDGGLGMMITGGGLLFIKQLRDFSKNTIRKKQKEDRTK